MLAFQVGEHRALDDVGRRAEHTRRLVEDDGAIEGLAFSEGAADLARMGEDDPTELHGIERRLCFESASGGDELARTSGELEALGRAVARSGIPGFVELLTTAADEIPRGVEQCGSDREAFRAAFFVEL